MVQNGCKDAVTEISSHGIDQKRVHDLNLDVAVFLNLTQDHMIIISLWSPITSC